MIAKSTALLASTSPDLKTAKRIAKALDIEIRYQGPGETWTTSENMPTVTEVRAAERQRNWTHWFRWRRYYVVDRPGGGAYLFEWRLGQKINEVHETFLVMLLGLLVLVVLTAHAFIRHTLAPLRSLREGVSELSEGNLDVVVSAETRDELGLLANAFNQMVQRVRDMVSARDRLLLDVSHELRSPITRMNVALELLPESEIKQSLKSDVAEMETMITEILEIERLKDGRDGLRRERHDLAALLRKVAEAYQGMGPGVCLADVPGEIPLDIDPRAVKTVAKNLLENALKFSLADSRPVEIAARESDGVVVVRISDDGPGIPTEDLPQLFEPFFRVDRSRSKRTGGYGLGLSMCKRIMEAHGGSITVESNPVRGASFVLTFRR